VQVENRNTLKLEEANEAIDKLKDYLDTIPQIEHKVTKENMIISKIETLDKPKKKRILKLRNNVNNIKSTRTVCERLEKIVSRCDSGGRNSYMSKEMNSARI
jgi:predicted transcriptional regulator